MTDYNRGFIAGWTSAIAGAITGLVISASSVRADGCHDYSYENGTMRVCDNCSCSRNGDIVKCTRECTVEERYEDYKKRLATLDTFKANNAYLSHCEITEIFIRKEVAP